MVAGCGNKTVKYIFWIINFLFFVLGGVICGLSLWIRFDNSFKDKVEGTLNVNLSNFPIDTVYSLLYVIAGFGLLLLILGFFGCCGSCVESVCVIGIYFVFVLILFVLEVAGIVIILINKDNVHNQFNTVWRNDLVNHYNDNEFVRNSLDNIQRQLQCCGAYGCTDYPSPPQSCPMACQSIGSQQAAYVPGCANLIFDTIQSNLIIVIVVAAVVLVVELAAMILSCVVCGAIKSRRT